MSESVLVTGASGFIGRALIALLVEDGYEVHAVRHMGKAPEIAGVTWHRADLLEADSADAVIAVADPRHLVHLAWFSVPGRLWTSPDNLRWVEASLRLVRAFAANGGRRAVLAGSCAEYDLRAGRCSETETPRVPASFYGACKNALGEVLTAHSRQLGYSAAWARIFFAYGPGERPGRLIPSVAEALIAGQPIDVTDGTQKRDFLYVDDIASALLRLLSADVEGPVNVGSGKATAVKTVVSAVASAIGRPELVRFGARPRADDDPPLVVADATRLRQQLGWSPAVGLEEGVARTVAWWDGATLQPSAPGSIGPPRPQQSVGGSDDGAL
jgi:nucleoside-diphosphate-sugar epimerase